MKILSATLMTAAGAAAAMLWMNRDRYLNREYWRSEGTAGTGAQGGIGSSPDFSSDTSRTAPAVQPVPATH